MTIEHTLRFEIVTTERSPAEVQSLAEVVYEALAVPKPHDRHATMVWPNDNDAAISTVDVFIDVLADDDDELTTAVAAARNAFRNFGLEIVGDPELRASRPVEVPTVRTPGLTYDAETQALTIEAGAPEWHDVELTIVPRGYDRALALIADHEAGRRREHAVPIKTLTIRRPAGNPTTTQP